MPLVIRETGWSYEANMALVLFGLSTFLPYVCYLLAVVGRGGTGALTTRRVGEA